MQKTRQYTTWPVVPLCEEQYRDIRNCDVLESGLYRKCDIYKGGGGYDRFGDIHAKRFNWLPNSTQFVVQLYGCPLNCDYCYVTRSGVFGTPIPTRTTDMLESYQRTGLDVFHLMGGAPALYLENWKEIATDERVRVFHSDFLLVEKPYKREWLDGLPGLFAISIKDFPVDFDLMWRNLKTVVESGINFYITFTGRPVLRNAIVKKFGKDVLTDSFVIRINRKYAALTKKEYVYAEN